jgi:ATP synthase protein I
VALDFVFALLAGAGLGWLFDRWRVTMPWGLLVGLALGFVFAFLRIVRATQAQERAEASRKRDSGRS